MQGKRRQALAALAAGAALVLAGCPGPARAPQRSPLAAGNIRDLNAEVAAVAAREPGAGTVAALVLGNMALLATNMEGTPATPGPGPATDVRAGRAAPPGPGEATAQRPGGPGRTTQTRAGPENLGTTVGPSATGQETGPGGAVTQAARPGGGVAQSPVMPGGGPTSVSGGGPGATAPPGWGGANVAPTASSLTAVHNRIATAVRDAFPFIADVRFVLDPQHKHDVAFIQTEAAKGRSIGEFLPHIVEIARGAPSATGGLTPIPGGTPQPGYTPKVPPGPAGVPGTPGRPGAAGTVPAPAPSTPSSR